MLNRSKAAAAAPALAMVATGILSAGSAHAATPYVTAATAGTKVVGAPTYVWGSTSAAPGAKICSQVALGARWSTSHCSTVKSDHTYAIPLTYGSGTPGTYIFHVVTSGLTSSSVKLTRVKSGTSTATTPSTPSTTTTTTTTTTKMGAGSVSGTGYTLYSGYNGVKVYLAQKALGINAGPASTTIGPATSRALINFRAAHHLPAAAVLDQATWNLLPIQKDSQGVKYPFNIDSWSATSQVLTNAPRDLKVAAEISFAKAQLGKPYIWGGTGPIGFDCSGLLLQAARAGGMHPTKVNNLTDISPASALANGMFHDSEFQKGTSTSNPQLGDFIYYGGSNGVAGHVSMYIGNGQVINAITDRNAQGVVVSGNVRISSLSSNAGWSRKLGVNRAIPL